MKPPISKISLARWTRSTLAPARTVRAGGRTLAVLAATAMLLGFSAVAMAGAAQAQTEVLDATVTTTSGAYSCIGRGVGQQRSDSAAFQTKTNGIATGQYPGTFNETGSASLHGNYGSLGFGGTLSISFTITSDNTTITGGISKGALTGGVYCGSFGFATSSATYTATIQAHGQATKISGAAAVAGSLYTQPGSQESLNATLTLP